MFTKSSTTFFIIVLLALATAIFTNKFYSRDRLFRKKVSECNGVSTQLRFSCYRAAIEGYYGRDPKAFIKKIKNDQDLSFEAAFVEEGKISYAIFGTNCHTFYHAAGDFMATHFPDKSVKELLAYGTKSCTNGYTMGLYKRLAIKNRFNTELLKEFWKSCLKGAENQCAHEIGHILHDKYFISILKTLDDISKKEYGLTYPTKYNYVVMKKTNFDAPFEDCRSIIGEKKVAQCYTGIGHNLFLFSEFSKDGYKAMFDQCNEVKDEDKEFCYEFFIFRIGINEGAVRFINNEFEEGNKLCREIVDLALEKNPSFNAEELMLHCYRGIGGGIGLFVDSEYTETRLHKEKNPEAAPDILNYGRLCDESIENQIDQCYQGLLGTRYNKLYQIFKIYIERIEEILPTIESDFEIVG